MADYDSIATKLKEYLPENVWDEITEEIYQYGRDKYDDGRYDGEESAECWRSHDD